MKNYLLSSLLLLLLTLSGYSLPSTTSKPELELGSRNDYGKSDPGSIVPDSWNTLLVDLTTDEAVEVGEIIDENIEKAFNEGYKQGTLDWRPELEALKESNRLEKAQVWWDGFWIGTGTSTVVIVALTAGAVLLQGAVSR